MCASIYLIFISFAFMQTVYTQCPNRVVQGPNGPIELLPNQVLVPSGSNGPYLGPLLPPGVPLPPPGRVYLPPGPCKQPQFIINGPIPEYANIANLGPIIGNLSPLTLPNVLSGNVIVPNIASGIPNAPVVVPNVAPANIIVPNKVSGNVVVPNAVSEYAPTIIHDNSVANSLANALQLLVVSSLLSNTLPSPYEPPYLENFMPGYNYIY